MIITKVKLENFGRHKLKEFTSNASVVGLLGKNGCGKSTFLQAIEYAITGILAENAETYIRHGAKRAVVELEFLKNGQVGKVVRRITATATSRELVWQEKTYTKSAEVDAIMADVLGADRQAVSNAVFLEQGSLDKILFSSQSEREQVFTRMLNVSFLEKTCGILDGKIKQYGSGIEDVGVVFDEIAAQLTVAEAETSQLNGAASLFPDHSKQVSHLRDLLGHLEHVKIYREKVTGALSNEQTVNLTLDAAVRASGFNSYEEAQNQATSLDKTRDLLNGRERHLSLQQGMHTQWSRIALEMTKLNEQQETENNRLNALRSVSLPRSSDLSELLLQLTAKQGLQQQLKETKDQLSNVARQMAARTARPTGDADGLRKTQREHHETMFAIRQERTVLSAVLAVNTGKAECCPVCRQSISPELLDRARISTLQEQEQTHINAEASASRDLLALEGAQRAWDNEQTKLTDQIIQATQRSGKLDEQIKTIKADSDLEDTKVLLANARENEQNTQQTEFLLADLKVRMQKLLDERMPLVTRQHEFVSFEPAQLVEAHAALEENRKQRDHLNNTLLCIRAKIGELAKVQGEREGFEAVLHKTHADLARLGHVGYNLPSIEGVQLEKADLEAKEGLRAEAFGRAKQARANYNQLQDKLTALELRRAKNASRQQTLQELVRVREVLGRSNLPMTYVSYQFQRLAVLTQQVLNEMGAPFTIEVNPDSAVSFLFTRTDEADAQTLDMSKLSGGQKVRLSIAFLIAVQRLIIPDVGLLILDEPSTHLDAEAVDSLKDLLMSMSKILQNTGSQVWVVDHNPALEVALGASVNLDSI